MKVDVSRSISAVAHRQGGGMRASVKHTINAAHRLPGTLLHGHTYRLTATIEDQRDPKSGQILLFDTIKQALITATSTYDHDQLERTLAELPATAENLAICVARSMSKALGRLVNIRIEVGDDGSVETQMYQRDGEFFSA